MCVCVCVYIYVYIFCISHPKFLHIFTFVAHCFFLILFSLQFFTFQILKYLRISFNCITILNKIINATLLFLPPFFMSWTKYLRFFLCTQKGYFSQILSTNLSKSVLVSTSPSSSQVWHIKMLIREHDYCTGVPQAGHNKRPL